MRSALIFGGLALVLVVPGAMVAGKERLIAAGEPLLLELAPRDPRSLMQGDYMALDYKIVREFGNVEDWPRDGALVVRLDDRGVAGFVRRYDGGQLGDRERLLRYRRRGRSLRLGAEEFFFQEGEAARFSKARYSELRAGASGNSVLVGLCDAEGNPLGRGRAFTRSFGGPATSGPIEE
jgi:uncharacterized membrane-anchored protein